MFFPQKKAILGLSVREFNAYRTLYRLSKNMVNVRLYAVLRPYFAERSHLAYESVYHQMKNYEFDKLLSTDIAQQTLKVVARSFKFFVKFREAVREKLYFKKVNMPYYKCVGRVFHVDY